MIKYFESAASLSLFKSIGNNLPPLQLCPKVKTKESLFASLVLGPCCDGRNGSGECLWWLHLDSTSSAQDIGSQILLEVGLIPHFWQWLSFFFGPQQCFHICYHTINPTVRRQLSGVAATDAMQDKALKFDAVRFGQALVKWANKINDMIWLWWFSWWWLWMWMQSWRCSDDKKEDSEDSKKEM